MSETKSNDAEGVSLTASLLIAPTTATAGKSYTRIWRKYYLVFKFTTLQPYLPLPSQSSSHQLPRTWSSSSGHAIDIREVDHEDIVRIVKERDLPSLISYGGINQVASVFGCDLERGIGLGQVSLQQISSSVTVSSASKELICNLRKACNSFTVFLLLMAAGLSFAIENIEEGPRQGWHDGVAILVAVFVIVIFHSIAEFRRQRELQKNKKVVEVVRNGEQQLISANELVRGDLLSLKKGDLVPADGLFVNGDNLVLDQQLNSEINHDENPILCAGSKVTEGNGRMLVVFVAANTAYSEERTILQTRIEKPNSYADCLSLIVTALIAFVVLIRLLGNGQQKNDDVLPELKGQTKIDVLMNIFNSMFWRPRGRISILTGVVTAIVIGLQHGMSLVVTVSLSCWNEIVELSGAEPRNLSVCGNMGLVTVICINASGGLISDEMEVSEFHVGGEKVGTSVACENYPIFFEALRQNIEGSTLVPEMLDSPQDDLLVSWAESMCGANVGLSNRSFSVVDHARLRSNMNSDRFVVTNKNEDGTEIFRLHLKGDALPTLNSCSHYYDIMGQIHAIDGERRNFEGMIYDMKKRGLRVIALACKEIETLNCSNEDCHLLALVGLKYSRCETLEALKNAGVRIMLVSQEELSAVESIAHGLGVIQNGSNYVAFEGEQIRDLTETERVKKIEEAVVIGSCQSADDMLLIVNSLQQGGSIVAFFGGLTTIDLPALMKADVGITKRNLSTGMAREISDIVIPDEHSLDSLPRVMQCGRCAYYNIRNFSQLQLIACISGLLINLVAAMCLWDSPLTPIQMIWVNFVTCFLGYRLMVMEPRSREFMTSPPSNWTDPLLNRVIWKKIAIQTSLLLVLHLFEKVEPSIDEETWKSLVFNSFMLCQIFNQIKTLGIPTKLSAKAKLDYLRFLLALVTVMTMQVVLVEFAPSLAGCERLNLVHWLISFGIAAVSLVMVYAVKVINSFISDSFSGSGSGSSNNSMTWSSTSRLLALFLGIPFSVILILSLSYYSYPDDVHAFRR